MNNPFPGMNPYLEHPGVWPSIHLLLIAEIANFLGPKLRPKYRVAVEVRLYETNGEESLLIGIPDVTIQRSLSTSNPRKNVAILEPETKPITVNLPIPETIKQGYLEVREVATKEVVTAIEILSPVNKRQGKGRESYCEKRLNIFDSKTHFVEIDLLRMGKPLPVLNNHINSHYRILISNSNYRPKADLYAFNIQQKIPIFSLPLKPEDSEPLIDLNSFLNSVYEKGSYDLEIDYNQNPIPSLGEEDLIWTKNLLKANNLT